MQKPPFVHKSGTETRHWSPDYFKAILESEQTKQVEAGAVVEKLCCQQHNECSSVVAQISVWQSCLTGPPIALE